MDREGLLLFDFLWARLGAIVKMDSCLLTSERRRVKIPAVLMWFRLGLRSFAEPQDDNSESKMDAH